MKYIDEEDITIEQSGSSNRIGVFDCDGEVVAEFPEGTARLAIFVSIRLANKAYKRGIEFGTTSTQRGIRRELGL